MCVCVSVSQGRGHPSMPTPEWDRLVRIIHLDANRVLGLQAWGQARTARPRAGLSLGLGLGLRIGLLINIMVN